ncbi:IclR family transcriptional regulator [Kocuria oceani]|jgi:DNA-binding IclR family transcriptional regulator|uniref:IclR family transcriptional regulator n=1 Tax=Kocuria oceani TaxID=988827 RepID=UPI002405C659|nr:IclR family transcriptional regulator [Kocuria oceani]
MTTRDAGLASVQKAFALLDVVARDPRGATAKDISAALGIPLPSVYRLLQTLVASEHVVHLRDQRRYGLGYKVHALDTSLRQQVGTPGTVRRAVRDLHASADAAAYFAVYRGDAVVVAHVVDSPRRPRLDPLDFGFTDAAHATAFGKILLARMDRDEVAEYLQRHGMPGLTERTLRTPETLHRELRRVRAEGIAVEREEFVPGASCLAAPVLDAAGRTLGSVAVSLRPPDFERRHRAIVPVLRDAADRVGRALRAAEDCPVARRAD